MIEDPENPEWTAEDFARARPPEEVLPPQIASQFKRSPGRPVGSLKAFRKEQIALRVDPDVLEHFRSGGPGWQSRMNTALRESMQRQQ